MAFFSVSRFDTPVLTAAFRLMDLLYFARSAATTMITHHSRAATASARRLRPASPQATLTRISTAAVRIALLFTLPFTLLALLFIRLSNALRFQPRRVLRLRRQNTPRQQTVLLTSNRASNPLALSLARTLHGTGTRVAVAHSSSSSPPALPPSRFASLLSSILPPPTSFSAAVASSLRLRIPARRQRQEDESAAEEDHDVDDSASLYEHEVLGAILRVRPSVWVPCELLVDYDDDTAGAADDDAAVVREAVGLLRETLRREAERERPRVRCGVLAPEGPVAGVVAGEDGDDGVFRRLVEGLDCGVEVVGGRDVVVRRRGEVHGLLHAGRRERRRWELVEPEGGEVVQLPVDDDYGCLDETYERLARLDISDARPWVMREVIEGEAYRIHAIVLNGAVRAFAVSTPDDPHELDAGRLFLAPSSPLHASIQAFVNAFVAALPGRPSLPLAIDLTVRTEPTPTGTVTRIHPTRCSWNLLPLTTTPPFSTAAAELVASVSPPPPQPQRSPPRQQPVDTDDEPVPSAAAAPPAPPRPPSPPTTDPAAALQPTKQPIPPAAAADLQTPPNSPVLNPLVTRFVASTLPPTPPSSPDSRRSRSVDAAADNASSSSSPPRSSLRRSKRDVATAGPAAAVRSRCYACSSSSHRRRTSSDESGSESSGRGSGSGSERKAGGGGPRAKVRFEELPPPVAEPPPAPASAPSSSSLSAATATAAEPQPQPQPQQQQQVRSDEAVAAASKPSSSSSAPAKRRISSDAADVSAVVPGVAGTYSLPRTLWAYVLLPLLEVLFSLRPRRGIVAVAQGAAVLVERVLLPGAWVEEGWRWWDAGPWLWEWGVRRLVGV